MFLFLSLFAILPGVFLVHATSDFSLSAPLGITCFVERPACKYTVTVTSLDGFTGTVSLSITAYPYGTTESITPTSVTLSSGGQATAQVSDGPPTGGTVTVQGVSGALAHSVSTHITIVT